MNYFWTADSHCWHANILKYCNRPWIREGDLVPSDETRDGLMWVSKEIAYARADEMTEAIIENWNGVIKDGDTVYHLGDLAFVRTVDKVEELLGRLNGDIHLYIGNHDNKVVRKAKGFASIRREGLVMVGDVKIWNSHRRFTKEGWRDIKDGAWHCFGHAHGKGNQGKFELDVGVDCHDFTTLSFEQVAEIMNG